MELSWEQVGGAEYVKITVKLETGLGENTAYDTCTDCPDNTKEH